MDDESRRWDQHDLASKRCVYWWVDGTHTRARSEGHEWQCLLVTMSVTPDGKNEHVAIADDFRESKASWSEGLLDLKAHGQQSGPLLAVGDGAMGSRPSWKRRSRPRGHSAAGSTRCGNTLNASPSSQQAIAKTGMQPTFMAATRADRLNADPQFVERYAAKYPKAVEKLKQDRGSLIAIHDFPAEH